MDDSQEISLTKKQRHWLEHLRACEASGQGIAAYAAEYGFAAQAMYAGKKILTRKGVLPPTRPTRFQRVQDIRAVVGSEWRIHLPNGVSVAFSGSVDAGALTTVLNTAATPG